MAHATPLRKIRHGGRVVRGFRAGHWAAPGFALRICSGWKDQAQEPIRGRADSNVA